MNTSDATATPGKSVAQASQPEVHKPAARTAAKHIKTAAAQAPATAKKAPKVATAIKEKAAKPLKVKAAKPAADAGKAKKDKRVTEEFRLPQSEQSQLKALKVRAGKLLSGTKKSTLLRAAIKTLAQLPDAALLAALKAVADKPAKT